jgi:hypothetical protein
LYGKRKDNAIASEEETTGWTRDEDCLSAHEILLIAHLDPIERRGPARSSAEILNRINWMLCDSSPTRESRALSSVSRLIGNSNEGTHRKIQLYNLGDRTMDACLNTHCNHTEPNPSGQPPNEVPLIVRVNSRVCRAFPVFKDGGRRECDQFG